MTPNMKDIERNCGNVKIGKLLPFSALNTLKAIDVPFTKEFRDFVMKCLNKHRNYDYGVFEALQWASNSLFKRDRIIEVRYWAERRKEYGNFLSYWEIPERFTGTRWGERYFLYLFTDAGTYTEISIITAEPNWYERYLKTKLDIANGCDILAPLGR